MTKTRIECATTSHTVEEGECPWCTIGRLRTALEKIRGWTQGDDYAVARVCNEALGALHPTMARILEAHDVPPQTPNTDLLSAAKGIVKLLEDVGNEVGWDAGSHTDRVYAWYEFDDLRAAIARIENRICQHDFQKPACTAIADDPRHAHCTVCGTTWMILSGEPTQHHEPTARRSGELLPCENCGHGIVAHVQNGGNCPTPPLKSEAERIYGSLTARDPEDVTRALWTRTGYWKEWRNPGPKCPRCHQFEGHSPECNAVRTSEKP